MPKAGDLNRRQATEPRCLKTLKGYIREDHIKNEDMRENLKYYQHKIK
jgi:hypothetical protein